MFVDGIRITLEMGVLCLFVGSDLEGKRPSEVANKPIWQTLVHITSLIGQFF